MDDFNDEDFNNLPIKPRGKPSPRAASNPSPNNNKSSREPSPNVSASSLPLMSEEKNNSKNDSDYEITFNSHQDKFEDEKDIVIPRGVPDSNNYKLNFDDLDFEKDARDSGVGDGSGEIDFANNAIETKNNDSFGLGSLSLNDKSPPGPEGMVDIGKSVLESTNVEQPEFKEEDPVKRKGVTFQMDMDETFDKPDSKFNDASAMDDPFATSGFAGEDDFSALSKSEFIDNLDYLEQCGESDADKMERQAALARQSLYQRFDPLVRDGTPVKADRQRSGGLAALKQRADQILQKKAPLTEIAETSQIASPNDKDSLSKVSPPSNERLVNADTPSKLAASPRMPGADLVDPLLYTEKDMLAKEAKWKKQIQQLEALRNEEIAMRELVEQDAREKQDSLRSENEQLSKAVEEYEKTIIQLSETTQEDTLLKQDTVAALLKEKEQLQNELNAADKAMYDYYKRMEKMKTTIDSLKQNEASLNSCIDDYQQKLKDSEDRYQNLRKQAEASVERANIEIDKVKKAKEVDLAGLRAALKQIQARHAGTESALRQKISENEELTKICDDLINRVTPGS